MRPHRRQPTRLPRPWDSPGKNIRVGCHFLLPCMKVKSEGEVAQSCPTPSDPMDHSTTVHHQLLKLMPIESVMPSNHFILCHPLLLLPSIYRSSRAFSNESVLHIRQPKYCSFSFNISPSNEHPGLISFWMDWLISLQSKGLSRVFSIPQFKSINSSVLSFLYSPTLTSIHDYWKNHSTD